MRVIIVANRLPVNIEEEKDNIIYSVSPGGLVSSLNYFLENFQISSQKIESLWIGWPGKPISKKNQSKVNEKLLKKYHSVPVFLTQKQVDEYYLGFSNKTVWPLFHYFSAKSNFDPNHWEAYKAVNKEFFHELTKVIQPGDVVFVQDYQLMLLPMLLRAKYPDLAIGFFLHIPFPSYEIFRMLPEEVRKEILTGLLGADMVGFHTNDYSQHFLENIDRILGVKHIAKSFEYNNRLISVEHIPLGINYQKYIKAIKSEKIRKKVKDLKRSLKEKHILFSVDRLDYTKGINMRLLGYEKFLEKNPQFYKKVTLILNAQPSRTEIGDYQNMKEEVDEIVGRINGKFGDIEWTPIMYQYTSLDFEDMVVRYIVADTALVTPLRDGMNLVSKEFIACKQNTKKGVLILSETAGSAKELNQAILINPNNTDEIAEAIKKALLMDIPEQSKRMRQMIDIVQHFNSDWWAKDSIERIIQANRSQNISPQLTLNSKFRRQLLNDYMRAERRLLLLDYDGTLVPFAQKPLLATPSKKLVNLLTLLAEDFHNEVVITSGRDKDFLSKWFGYPKVALVAEHGMHLKERNQYYWHSTKNISNSWKTKIKPILNRFVERIPKSMIEEKGYSLAWHYRASDKELSEQSFPSLVEELQLAIGNTNLEILFGDKVIEIKDKAVNKGDAALHWTSNKKYDFIMAIGDDKTDEELFTTLPQTSYLIKVGNGPSAANYRIENHTEVLGLIEDLSVISKATGTDI